MARETLADIRSGGYPTQNDTYPTQNDTQQSPPQEGGGGPEVMPALNKIQLIINQPDYRGGPTNTPPKYIYGLGQALNDVARLTASEDGISREVMDMWIAGDSKPFMEEARVIIEGLTQGANVDMSIAGINGIINGIRAGNQGGRNAPL